MDAPREQWTYDQLLIGVLVDLLTGKTGGSPADYVEGGERNYPKKPDLVFVFDRVMSAVGQFDLSLPAVREFLGTLWKRIKDPETYGHDPDKMDQLRAKLLSLGLDDPDNGSSGMALAVR
jgi:hypothetical protein